MEGKNIRRGGVLLHVTSLPGPEGIGTLGKGAYAWIDFLENPPTRAPVHWRVTRI